MTKVIPKVELFQKKGYTNDNKVIYQVEQDGKCAKFTLPVEQEDSFDKVKDKMANTLLNDMNALNSKKGQAIGIVSTILGGGLGYYFARNKKPLTVALVAGLTGITTGFASLLLIFTSTIKDVKNSIQCLKYFDLKEYKD